MSRSTNPLRRLPWSRLLRFGVVGFSGFCVDFGITWGFRALLGGVATSFMLDYGSTGLGFCGGATSNYILNRRWTWRSDNPNVVGEFTRFFGVSLLGLGLHYLVLAFCLGLGGIGFWLVDGYWGSKLVATVVVMVWNFVANNFYTFRRSTSQGAKEPPTA